MTRTGMKGPFMVPRDRPWLSPVCWLACHRKIMPVGKVVSSKEFVALFLFCG